MSELYIKTNLLLYRELLPDRFHRYSRAVLLPFPNAQEFPFQAVPYLPLPTAQEFPVPAAVHFLLRIAPELPFRAALQFLLLPVQVLPQAELCLTHFLLHG